MKTVLLIMAFGAVGALARFGINQLALRVFGPQFPYGTLIANIAGCLLFGYLVQALAVDTFSPAVKIAVLTGFLGALTTFSAFGHETIHLAGRGNMMHALANVGLNVVLGLSAVAFGLFLGKTIHPSDGSTAGDVAVASDLNPDDSAG